MTSKLGFEGLDYLTKLKREDDVNTVRDTLSMLEKAFLQTTPPVDHVLTAAEACLRPALAALNWEGQERHVLEALPHFDKVEHIEDLRSVLAHLNIYTEAVKTNLQSIDPTKLPCLFSVEGEDVMLIAGKNNDGTLSVFEGSTGETKAINATKLTGNAYYLELASINEQKQDIMRMGWMKFAIKKFRPALMMIFIIAMLTNIASLVLPLFVMHVYDMGIGTKSTDVVWGLAIGACLVIAVDLMLRIVRTKTMSYFAARFDSILSMQTFQQLIYLPLSMTESAPIGTQLNRIKQFEGIREAFTSTLAIAVVDLPFIVIFLAAIAMIATKIVWVPVILIVLFVVMALISMPTMRNNNQKSGELRSKTTNLAMELITKRAEYSNLNAQDMALERFKEMSEQQTQATFKTTQFNNLVRTAASALTNLAGIATLAVGAALAIEGQITVGALIASMALVWRVISPLQQSFLSISKVEQTLESLKQIDRMMSMKTERDPGSLPTFNRIFKGGVTLNRIMYRFGNRPEPTLKGISLDVKPGEVIALTGPSGSGKTTILKMLAGLYTPQSGAILADGVDLRTIDTAEWRGSLGFTPENAFFFYGTVAQNLKLGCPQASDGDMRDALRDMGVLDQVNSLEQGVETRLNGGLLRTLPDSFKQRLNLARCLTRKTNLYIFDNPTNTLDDKSAALFKERVSQLKGRSSVIYATQDQELMRKADRVIYLVNGVIVLEGSPEEVLTKLNNQPKKVPA